MSDELTEALNDFAYSQSLSEVWDSARRLMLNKRRASIADNPLLLRGLEKLRKLRFGMSACGPKRQFLRRNHTSEVGVKPTCQDSSTDAFVESPGGISPSGAPRTVHDPLESHGSRCSAVAMT